jgi:hypothetical protein
MNTKHPRVELKSVKIFDAMSEETHCFTAKVYLDGKLLGFVQNSGHGGCHDGDREVEEKLGEYAATLPPEPWKFSEGTFQPDFESVINDLLHEFVLRREAKKLIRKTKSKVVFICDGKIWTGSHPRGLDAARAFVIEKHGDVQIINDMKPKEAEEFLLAYV